ncbi:arsenical pump-driving ATPase [uncultured Tessaracoccus sp.]|uniref:arsenical pump-driving ATPase n=1 Tax=uncultured Tessaracoccus sp. TaxID=905023 RepID=UPI0025CCE162|nr:arsenical pump-driving ATPase [uncultured Tessaracoccus sp.]
MHFLDELPRHVFFTGKGGVGKTSIACATAVRLARAGRRVLLVSTDPASNIAQALGTTIGADITPVADVPGLSALEIDPDAAAAAYRESILAPVRPLLPERELATITEQLSGSCTTEIASFNEFTGLLADPARTEGFDHVLFDTAPTGHTIRLLQLPGSWTSFLDEGKGDASCLGPMSGLERHRSTYRTAVEALTDPGTTRLVLVARAQTSTLREVARTAGELAELGIRAHHLVVNAVLPAPTDADSADPLHAAVHARERAALEALPAELRGLDVDLLPLRPDNMVGLDALEELLAADAPAHPVTGAQAWRDADAAPPSNETLLALVDQLESRGRGLVMTVGKGGVGKTTVAAAIALALARRGHDVHLTTTDPAAHLDTTVAGEVEHLTVDAIDPERATQEYRDKVMATKGASLDDAGRAALREDLLSPCTEEVAVFQQFSRAVGLARSRFVVMDTAPTGHTLLLMDATGSYHREMVRHLDERQRARATTPLMRLQDPDHTSIIVVTLPETTPVAEAEALVEDLARADMRPWAWVVNNSLLAARPSSPLLARRAAQEREQVDHVRELAPRMALVATRSHEPVGVDALERLLALTDAPAG